MKLYKLTDKNHQTYNNTQWGPGVSHSGTGIGDLCGPGWIHAYTDPRIALIMNPIHADFKDPILWEAEGTEPKLEEPLKIGVLTLTTMRIIRLPELTLVNKIAFGILSAKKVYKDSGWNVWADNWLNNIDRSATYAANYTTCATSAAAATYAAVDAASYAAVDAAAATYAAVDAASYAADATSYAAATSYADATSYAAATSASFIKIMDEAMKIV